MTACCPAIETDGRPGLPARAVMHLLTLPVASIPSRRDIGETPV
jgi:hypothetical protein